MNDQSKLEYWFDDLDKEIDEYSVDLCIGEIQLRAIKCGLDHESKEIYEVINDFARSVKNHNKPFVALRANKEAIAICQKKLAILEGKRVAKSASQRRLMESASHGNKKAILLELTQKLEKLEAERDSNPAYLLSQKQEKLSHHQVVEIPGRPGWVSIQCAGGCGRQVELRGKKVGHASFYVCDSVASGRQCDSALPLRKPGEIMSIAFNAAAHFKGITYKWPTPAQGASVQRAQGILSSAQASITRPEGKPFP